jgi:hypothetical protein
MAMSSREQDWEALYGRLLEVLTEFGKNGPLGAEGDYWLIDDDWGGLHHKIEVVSADFWSDAVHQRIRQTLANSFPDWGVFVVFSEKAKGRRGFIVYADRVEFEPDEC